MEDGEESRARLARSRWSQPPVRGLAGWSGKGLLCTSPTASSGTRSTGPGPQYSASLPRGTPNPLTGATGATTPSSSHASDPTNPTTTATATVLPRRSPHVGMFAHAPPTRGFKDLFYEPYTFSMSRPALTQMDLARQERFRARHVEPAELQQLPASLYRECRRAQRRSRRALSKSLGALDVEASSQFAWSYTLVAGPREVQAEDGDESDEEEQPWQFPMQGVDDEEGAAHAVVEVEAGLLTSSDDDDDDSSSEEEEEEGGPPVCVICLEGFEAADVVRRLPDCGHIHHKRCIDLWLRGVCSFEACYTRSCPTCKTPIQFPNPPTTTTTAATAKPITAGSQGTGLVARIFEIPRSAYARVGSLLLQGGGDGAATTTAATQGGGGV